MMDGAVAPVPPQAHDKGGLALDEAAEVDRWRP
jgi:hypothetical protein